MARILVTREFAEPLRGFLMEHGFEVTHVPLVKLEATHASPPVSVPDAVIVTSQAVARFVPDLSGHIQGARVVSVGVTTADALLLLGVASKHVGVHGGLDALPLLHLQEGERAWYVGAKEPSEKLLAALDEMGLERWAVYQNTRPPRFERSLLEASFDGVAFTSGSAVRAFVEVRGIPDCPVIALGNSTAQVAEALGLKVTAIAERTSLRKLADAVAAQF